MDVYGIDLDCIGKNLHRKLEMLYDGYVADEVMSGIRVARGLGIEMVADRNPRYGAAFYTPTDRGCIVINFHYAPTTIAHGIRHEIAHHLLWAGACLDYECDHGLWGDHLPLQPGLDAAQIRHILCKLAVR